MENAMNAIKRLTLATCLAATTTAHGFTGEEIQKSCNNDNMDFCNTYAAAFVMGATLATARANAPQNMCPQYRPEKGTRLAGQYLKDFLNNWPEPLTDSGSIYVWLAMRQAYPC